jgi:hypothetical protein
MQSILKNSNTIKTIYPFPFAFVSFGRHSVGTCRHGSRLRHRLLRAFGDRTHRVCQGNQHCLSSEIAQGPSRPGKDVTSLGRHRASPRLTYPPPICPQNPDNPKAAELFHDLTKAYETLRDPTTRSTFDAAHKAKVARKARFTALDSKRKSLAEALVASEREFKRAKMEEATAEARQAAEIERLKEESARLRRERESRQRQFSKQENQAKANKAANVREDDDDLGQFSFGALFRRPRPLYCPKAALT